MILSRLSNISGKLSNWGLSLILAVSLCSISTQIPAQTPEAGALANPQVRSKTVSKLRQKSQQRKSRAWNLAQKQGWATKGEKNGRQFELMAIENGKVYMYSTDNVDAAISSSADLVRNTSPYNANGSGYTVGVWDGGSARTTHQEFGSRITVQDGASGADHATHVTGTIAASGVDSNALGMAPSISVDAYEWTDDTAEMASRAMATAGESGTIQISNHSYGFVAGWADGYTPIRWYGTWGDRESDSFGIYSSYAEEWDTLLFNAPYYLPFKSAGNDRNDTAPSDGTSFDYWDGFSWITKSYDSSTDPYSDNFDNGGYDTVPQVGVSKNIITIGSVSDAVSGGVRSLTGVTSSSFSGWGPTDDGRIKPDIVANGELLYSSINTSDTSYGYMSGTSMASPNAAGSATLLVDYYDDLFPGEVMRASTLKGLIIHTADDLGNSGPDYSFGWGLMDTKAAADQLKAHQQNPSAGKLVEAKISAYDTTDAYSFTWDGSSAIRATLCWTDPPAEALDTLDDTSPRLINDLDLTITGPGGSPTYQAYVLDPLNPSNSATTGDNDLDNVEQVYLASPGTSGVYTVQVAYEDSLQFNEQRYSLLINGQAIDDLAVTPVSDFALSTPTGGPFSPSSQTYILENGGVSSLSWTASKSAAWFDLSPASGSLAAEATTEVTVTLNSNAAALAASTTPYTDTITFTNTGSGVTFERDVELEILTSASIPFSDGFESGSLASYWQSTGTGDYRTAVTTDNTPYSGSYHVVFDDSTPDTNYSRNELTLILNLAGYESVSLDFYAKSVGDEAHPPAQSPFISGSDFDGVAISEDGVVWFEVQALRTPDLTTNYQLFTVDLDAAIASYGLNFNSTFRIRFNQYDSYPAATDGIAIDEISVTGTSTLPTSTPTETSTQTPTPTQTSTETPTETPTPTLTPTPTATQVSTPAKVTGVNATKSDYPNLVLVTWDSLGSGVYEVWRNTTNDVGSASLVRTTGSTAFYDTGISTGVRYYYWVRNQNQYGYGEFSDSDWGYAGVPPTVLGMTVTKAASVNWIRVTWESLGGGIYEVWRSLTTDVGEATLVRTTGDVQFYDTAITQGVRYYYWVRAKNRFGYGAYCDPGWGYAGAPPAVINVTATNAASASWVRVEWDSLEGGAYEVWRNTVDDSYTSTLIRTTGDTWFYDATVTPGVRYYYWILGMNRYGYGTDSDSAWGFAGTPPAVLDLDAGKATYGDRIPVSWGSMEGGAYEVWRGTTDDVGSAALVRLTGDTSWIDLSIASGARYYYWVRALNRFGNGDFGDSVWGYAGTPPAVLGLAASDGTYTNRITVDWESLGGGTYQIWRNTSDYSGTAELRKTIGDCTWIDWDVIPGEVYYYWVNGINRFGTGDIGNSDPGSANNE